LGPWWAALAQAHGHLQLYGWAGCFVFGVALHFVPRLRGTPLPYARALPWIVAAQVAGLLLRMAAQPLLAQSGAMGWRVCLLVSGILEALALGGILALFAALVWRGQALRSRSALWSVLPPP